MPPDAPAVTGRCYCGQTRIEADASPFTVAYCHCGDCRRWTGAPAPAFAAFREGQVRLTPAHTPAKPVTEGVTRWICPDCGSALLARFDYLLNQVYVPLGVIDQAQDFPPELHCHADAALPWLHLDDGLPRTGGSGRGTLNAT